MKHILKRSYLLPTLITIFISFTACILVSQYTMKIFNITIEFIQLLCAFVSFVLVILFYIRRKDVFIYSLLIKALGCFLLGELYWVLHLYIKGYEQLGTFSISDLSWIGFYIFLLSIYSSVFHKHTAIKSPKFRKYSILAFIAPIFIVVTSILLYITGDDLFYTLIYCLPTSFLGYISMKYILLPSKSATYINPFRKFNVVVGLIILLDNLSCLLTNFGFIDAEYFFKFCFAMLLLFLSSTSYEGVEKWSIQ